MSSWSDVVHTWSVILLMLLIGAIMMGLPFSFRC